MDNKGLISVIIPIYNGKKWLHNAVNSALSQTYKNLEILLIDDGSTDESLSLCKEFCTDSRVKVFHKQNGGQSSARNFGLENSTGEYIQFLDCDDTLELNACAVAVSFMKDTTDFVLYGFNIYSFGKLLRTPHCERISYTGQYQDFKKISRLLDSPCDKLYRRSYLKKEFRVGYVYGEDGIFNYDNLRENINIEIIQDCLYNVNLDNPESVNRGYKIGRLQNTIESISTKLHKISTLFGVECAKKDFVPELLSTLSFTIILSASRLSYTDFKSEFYRGFINHNPSFISSFNSVKNLKVHNRVILYLVKKKCIALLYAIGRLSSVLK